MVGGGFGDVIGLQREVGGAGSLVGPATGGTHV